MQTIISATKEDSGGAIQVAVGDEIRVTLPEREATAGWKATVDGDAVAPAAAQSDERQVWEIGGATQTSLHTFRAVQEGRAVITVSYQAMQASGVQVLDEFSLTVTVGVPPKTKAQRERLPLPELAVVLIQFFMLSAAGLVISLLVGLSWGMKEDDPVQIFVGALGCVLFGAVCIYVLLRFVRLLIVRRFR